MTAILGKFSKQSSEVLDYDVDFTDWFSNRTDTPASFTATAETGIAVVSSARSGNVVKTILSGGTNGTKYKVTIRMTTSANLVKEADFTVTVKDV